MQKILLVGAWGKDKRKCVNILESKTERANVIL
jgi:hypothetical protein